MASEATQRWMALEDSNPRKKVLETEMTMMRRGKPLTTKADGETLSAIWQQKENDGNMSKENCR